MVFVYNIFLIFYALGIRIAAIFNTKASTWLRGRKNILNEIKSKLNVNKDKLIWIHSASLGEFEQGRTLIEEIKNKYPSYKMLVTFFSPSGYEVRKNYHLADYVFYLPMDGKKNASAFIDAINPSLAVFIKYELWYHYLKTLSERKIPSILISAIILPSQAYFGITGKFFQNMLNRFSHIFVQDQKSLQLLKTLPVTAPVSVSGDTRFDRVYQITQEHFTDSKIEAFCEGQQVLIAGSTWDEDEEALASLQYEFPSLKFIIAPHEINEPHINSIKKRFQNAACLSERNGNTDVNTLIIDSIGMLSKIYKYATLTYVGGGFNKAGIHNILEAAVHGKTVCWGPNYSRSAEAFKMIELGCGFSFQSNAQLSQWVKNLLKNESARSEKNSIASAYTKENLGATSQIMVFLQHSKILS